VLKTLIIATVLLPRLAKHSNPSNYRNRDSPANGAPWVGVPTQKSKKWSLEPTRRGEFFAIFPA